MTNLWSGGDADQTLNPESNPIHPVPISFDQQCTSDLRNWVSCRLTTVLGCSGQQFNGRNQGSDLFLRGSVYFLQPHGKALFFTVAAWVIPWQPYRRLRHLLSEI